MRIKFFTFFLITFFSFCFVCLMLTEIFLIFINYNYNPLLVRYINKNDKRLHHIFKDIYFSYDADLFWRPKKNFSVFNSQGFIGKELSFKKKDEIRIFVLGDSNTLGIITEYGTCISWPRYLSDLLSNYKNKIFLINAGVTGYSSFQGLRLLKKILVFKPDIVLICFGANDAHRVFYSDIEFSKRIVRSLKLWNFKVGQLLIEIIDKLYPFFVKNDVLVPRVSLKEYEGNLREMIELSEKFKFKLVFITRPFIGKSFEPLWWKNFAPSYNKVLRKIAKEKDIYLVDFYFRFKNKKQYFLDESHFNEEGHKKAAKILYKYLIDKLI